MKRVEGNRVQGTGDREQALPEGWRWVKLGEVCTQDKQIINPESYQAAELPYLSLEHVESETGLITLDLDSDPQQNGKSSTFFFNSSHVLYGKLRPWLTDKSD